MDSVDLNDSPTIGFPVFCGLARGAETRGRFALWNPPYPLTVAKRLYISSK
jgi:hypothetical protein